LTESLEDRGNFGEAIARKTHSRFKLLNFVDNPCLFVCRPTGPLHRPRRENYSRRLRSDGATDRSYDGSDSMTVVYLLATGETIEKTYREQTGSAEQLESKIDRYLRLLRLSDTELRTVSLMNKDSLEMTDEDRELILNKVEELLAEDAPI
jgi:L-asparaginase/Glu-tRNA(Gln) amidotransferase subunit D